MSLSRPLNTDQVNDEESQLGTITLKFRDIYPKRHWVILVQFAICEIILFGRCELRMDVVVVLQNTHSSES
jgi:hypothetical protein